VKSALNLLLPADLPTTGSTTRARTGSGDKDKPSAPAGAADAKPAAVVL
jgi:hypothetical protein